MPEIIIPGVQYEVSAAYADGKAFRISEEFTLANTGNAIVIKFVANVPFKLTDQSLVAHAGDVRMRAIAGATESGSFSTVITSFGKNRWVDRPRPYYTSQVSLTTGGLISGGTRSETLRAKTAGASGQASSINGRIQNFRSLPAGTYYLEFVALTNSCEFTFALEWEEK